MFADVIVKIKVAYFFSETRVYEAFNMKVSTYLAI